MRSISVALCVLFAVMLAACGESDEWGSSPEGESEAVSLSNIGDKRVDRLFDELEGVTRQLTEQQAVNSELEAAIRSLAHDGSALFQVASANRAVFARNPPVGTIMAWAGDAEPPADSGWVLCDGRELNTNEYRELANVLADYWGEPSENGKVVLPDLRGMFLRGAGGAAAGDVGSRQEYATALPQTPFVTDETGGHTHGMQASGEHTHEMSEDGEHTHEFPTHEVRENQGADRKYWHALRAAMMRRTEPAGKHKHTIHPAGSHVHEIEPAGAHSHEVVGGGDAETRPVNRAVHWIIRVK